MDGGQAFASILGGLVECGYGVAYRVLDAQYFGLAQRRKRVFVVGYLGDWRRAAAVLFERAALGFDCPPRRKEITTACFTPSKFSRGFGSRPNWNGVTGTLLKSGSETNPAICSDDGVSRYLTPLEWERLQGFPDNYTLIPYRGKPASDGPRQQALGNSMAVPCMHWIGERIQMVEDLPC
jgi:DNA (cytosine-5)-methyltransferase 1